MLLGHYRQQSSARATKDCRISKHLLLSCAGRFETAMYRGERRSSKSAISLAAFTAPGPLHSALLIFRPPPSSTWQLNDVCWCRREPPKPNRGVFSCTKPVRILQTGRKQLSTLQLIFFDFF